MSELLAWLAEPFHYRFVTRGLVVALLLGMAGGLVGCVLLLRRLVLVADAFSHALLPGVGLAWLWFGPGGIGLLAGAAIAGLATALASALVGRLTRLGEDAAFGSLFVLFLAAGVALMSVVAAPADVLHYLLGNILGVTAGDCWLVLAVTGSTVLAAAVFLRPLALEVFDPEFHRACGGPALATRFGILVALVANLVAALQAVGIVLALGMFILPAATAYLWCERFGTMLVTAAAYGGLMAAAGLVASYHLDGPSGACMVGCLGLGFVASLVASPRHGLIAGWRRGRARAVAAPVPGPSTRR